MIKCTVITAAGRKTDIFEETKTPKDILEYFDVDYSVATNSLDGVRLDTAGMNRSLRDLGITKDCRLSSIVKIDNAAKVVVTGSAAVVTSDVKLDDWKRIAKMQPEALALVDDESDEVLFRVVVSEGPGSINENGVCFGTAVNGEGKATVTILIRPEVEDKVQLVKDEIGRALLDLNALEAEVPDILKEIDEMEKQIDDNFVVM